MFSAKQPMTTPAIAKTLHGGRVYLTVGGKPIGRCTGVNPTQSFGLQPQYEIGSIFPYEHVGLRFTGTVTVARFMVEKQDFAAIGVPSGANSNEIAMSLTTLLSSGGVEMTVVDNDTGETVLRIPGAKCDSVSVTITANAVIMTNMTFQFGASGPMQVKPLKESTTGYKLLLTNADQG